MKQFKWEKLGESWCCKIGAYYLEVNRDENKFEMEITFMGESIATRSLPTIDDTLIPGDAILYFRTFLNSNKLDKYLKN